MGGRFLSGLAAVAMLASHAVPVAAQHAGHGASADGDNAAVAAYRAAMDRMMADMAAPYSGDPDRDFAQGMIPHHRAAIAMARTVKEHGEDPELRRLADEIIAAQEREIAVLTAWLARNP